MNNHKQQFSTIFNSLIFIILMFNIVTNCAAQQLQIVPSLLLLRPSHSSIDFNCVFINATDDPALEWNAATRVIFSFGQQIVYDSQGLKNDSIRALNSTAIRYSGPLNLGIVEASCQYNETIQSSNVITVPYLEVFTFVPQPKVFKQNETFVASCTPKVEPNSTLVGVDYFVNTTLPLGIKQPVGSWTLLAPGAYASAQFTTPSQMASLEVVAGEAEHPTYTAVMKPTHPEAAGSYFCRIVLRVPGFILTTRSNAWNTSGNVGLVPPAAALIILLHLMVILLSTSSYMQ